MIDPPLSKNFPAYRFLAEHCESQRFPDGTNLRTPPTFLRKEHRNLSAGF